MVNAEVNLECMKIFCETCTKQSQQSGDMLWESGKAFSHWFAINQTI